MAQAADEAPTAEVEGRAGAERTENMPSMLVTLDVSKLSGWLNADASCRVKGKHSRRGDMRASGRAWGRWRLSARAGRPDCGGEGRARAERTENMCPMSVTLDVSRLSGWLNASASCRVKGEA